MNSSLFLKISSFLAVVYVIGVAAAAATTPPLWCDPLAPYCSCADGILVCNNFTSFEQLDFGSFKNLTTVSTLVIEPRGSALDLAADSLNLGELAVSTFVMRNIKSFPFTTRLFENSLKRQLEQQQRQQQQQQQQQEQEGNIGVELEISHSTLLFTLDDGSGQPRSSVPKQCLNQSFIDELLLRSDRYSTIATGNTSTVSPPTFFAHLSAVRLGERVNYAEPLCNLLFRDAFITELELTQLNDRPSSNHLQQQQRLSFVNNTHMNNMDLLNSTIKSMKIVNSSLSGLDETLLERRTFAELNMFTLMESSLEFVAAGSDRSPFDSLRKLNVIGFNLNNWNEFIERSPSSLEWLSKLNRGRQKNTETGNNYDDEKIQNKDKQQWWISNELNNNELIFGLAGDELGRREYEYAFPDKHLCHFESFPHSSLVYPYIYFKSKLNCTCTLVWLLKNWKHSSSKLVDLNTTSVIECIGDEAAFRAAQDACNFDKRFQQCHTAAAIAAVDGQLPFLKSKSAVDASSSNSSQNELNATAEAKSPSSSSSSSSSSQHNKNQANLPPCRRPSTISLAFGFLLIAILTRVIQYFV
jgi:hypothetical protein